MIGHAVVRPTGVPPDLGKPRRSPRTCTGQPLAYLNSVTTALYDKPRLVFGLAEQRDLLAAGARPLLVEGPLDVLTVAGLGLDFAPVAACGTALTPVRPSSSRRIWAAEPSWPTTATTPVTAPP